MIGLETKKKTIKAVEVIKEDKEAFRLLYSQYPHKEEAFSHCVTSLPLSVADPDGSM